MISGKRVLIQSPSSKSNSSAKKLCIKSSNIVEDEDAPVVMLPSEHRLHDFTCPYTHSKFVEPMKSKKCIHRLSKVALDETLKSKRSQCPVPGCKAKWTKSSSSLDRDFELKMNEFFKSKINGNSLRKLDNALDLASSAQPKVVTIDLTTNANKTLSITSQTKFIDLTD